uniref:Serpin domain-containing protein n=1 Tax=Anopheles dirus TaxID=7168 RepID=A0A182NLW1_9DIPT
MGNLRFFVFTLLVPLLVGTLAHGGRLGSVPCKNCKHKVGPNSQRLIASPINLLNPDRYEFFTLDDKGKVVKRIMTFKEIQSIVAGSDITELKLFANKNNNDRIVSSVVSNVRNVLNNELNLMNGHEHVGAAELPISDVIGSQAQEPFVTSAMHDVLHKFSEGLAAVTSERITSRPTERTTLYLEQTSTTTPTPSPSTERLTTRFSQRTTQKPTTGTTQQTEERTTAPTTIRPTVSSTKPPPVRSTYRPTETSPKQRPTTVRPAESATTEQTIVRSTPRSTTTQTTEQPMTTVRPTRKSTTMGTTERATSTVPPLKLSTERRPLTTTDLPLIKLAETSATVTRTTAAPLLKASQPSSAATVSAPTEPPMFKEAGPSTTAARSTEAPVVKVSQVTPTTTTTTTTTEMPVITTTVRPLESSTVRVSSTVKPSEQPVEHSTQRSEEVSDTGDVVQHATKQSTEQMWNDSVSETTASSEETSSEESTEVSTTKLVEIVPQSTAIPITVEETEKSTVSTTSSTVSVSSTQIRPLQDSLSEDLELVTDLKANDDANDDSSEELTTTASGFSTLYADPAIQAGTTHQQTQISAESTEITTEVTSIDSSATELSVEADSSTFEDSTGTSDEQSDETQSTTVNLYSQELTTSADGGTDLFQTAAEQSSGQDTSTIPSDAQHAIHKIIESLQSISDNSGSDESEEADSPESPYTVDIPGMNYDTDAQSSINAIIQSLGQVTLGGGDSSIFTVTTDTTTTSDEEQQRTTDTTPELSTKTHPSTQTIAAKRTTTAPTAPALSTADTTTSLPVMETTSVEAPSEPLSNFNYNTNIMDTIEKFLSTFSGLPKDNTHSANLTEFNILGEYPSELNMTDYVDRTATVASVIKFPLSSTEAVDRSPMDVITTSEAESAEDTTTAVASSDVDSEPILSDTVASFMKLGEMLTMGATIVSTETPVAAPLELKTAIDEEETELLRFLSICSNLGTNVYDHLTVDRAMRGRSLVYSPFATVTTLSMLFLGTRGTTAESINGVIGLDEMTSFNPHLFFKSVAQDLQPKYRRAHDRNEPGHGMEWESTFQRTLLSDESRGGLQRFFKARIQEIYSTVAETVDFRQKDMLLKHMNGDFAREYVDTLKQLRSPLVSISRNRYRHECNDATGYGMMDFKPTGTPLSDGGATAVPSVTFRSGFSTGFSKTLDATILALPGATSNVSVFFLKPSDAAAITDLEAQLHNQSIANVLKLFPDETVRTAYAEVQLPYFTQTTMYNMTQSIRQLGLQNLFDPTTANFNGLQDSSTSNLFLSEIIQTDSFALCGGDDVVGRSLPLRSYSTNLAKYGQQRLARQSRSPALIHPIHRNRRKLLYRNRSASDPAQVAGSTLAFDTPFLYLVRHNPTGMVLYTGRFVGNRNE